MKLKQKEERKAQIIAALLKLGFKEDRWHHFTKWKKTPTGEEYIIRYKLMPNKVRRERGIGAGQWVRTQSAAYAQCGVTPEGKITFRYGLTPVVSKPAEEGSVAS